MIKLESEVASEHLGEVATGLSLEIDEGRNEQYLS